MQPRSKTFGQAAAALVLALLAFAAAATLHITGVTARYPRFSHLAGGVVLLAIGVLLLLRPQWLMFG